MKPLLRLLRSSIGRSAMLTALALWLPGAVVATFIQRETTGFLLAGVEAQVVELEEDLFETARHHRFFPAVEELEEEPLELDEVAGESMSAFLRRYIREIRRRQLSTRGLRPDLEWRLAMLGESDPSVLAGAPVEALGEVMLDEVPEPYHDLLEGLVERQLEAVEEDEPDLGSRDLVLAFAAEETLEDADLCLSVFGPDGRELATNVGEVSRTRRMTGSLTAVQAGTAGLLLEEDSDVETRWCLMRRERLSDGGRLELGHRFDGVYRQIRRAETLRDLLWALGLPLALTAAWLQSRPVMRFLDALGAAARRQARGEVGARLDVDSDSRDLSRAVTAVNQMLRQLDQTVQSLSRVSDSIAHDLRTPLSRLQGQLDLLKQSKDPSGELIEAVQDEADQLLSTFNALLRIAQVESGRKKQGFRLFDFSEVVGGVAELYAPVFAGKDIAFTHRVPRRRVEVQGDRDLWMQALSNLVENALKYTPEGGTVGLELDDAEARPRIHLVDSGPGIPESERDNVFRRFYRLQPHRGERGSGLGLSLVAAVCELHGATIELGGRRGLTVDIVL